MNRLFSRWSAWSGVEGLPLIIVSSNVLVYLFNQIHPGLADLLLLSHSALAAGEWWRVVTFVFVPPFVGHGPSVLGVVLMFLWFMFLHTMTTALEQSWGAGRFSLYFLTGWIATAAVGLVPFPGEVGNGYLQTSLFLAFATLFPETEVLLFFVLPVKVKWLGYVTWASLVVGFLGGTWLSRLALAAGLFNYFLVLGPELWGRARLRWVNFRNRRRFPGPR